MHRPLLFGLACVLVTSCSTGLSRAEAVESFQTANPDASTIEAACVVDALIEIYETEPVDEGDLAAIEDELSADPQREQFLLDQFRAKFRCGMTDGVEAQLRRELLANDIDGDAVDCVAEALTGRLTDEDLEVLINDEMTDAFYATFFDAVESCDALPS